MQVFLLARIRTLKSIPYPQVEGGRTEKAVVATAIILLITVLVVHGPRHGNHD